MSVMTVKNGAKPQEPRLFGYLAEYGSSAELVHAAEQVRDAGFARWDCLTPFPVHGLDRAMGVRKTILPWIVLGAGLTGLITAVVMQWYVNNPGTQSGATYLLSSYPLVISGKPYWSLPANVPIIFELAVLLSAFGTFFGLWALCGLPRFYHPAFGVARFRRVTDDKFFILVEAKDRKFDAERTRKLLEQTHPAAIEEVKD
jgi:hypothetical protein